MRLRSTYRATQVLCSRAMNPHVFGHSIWGWLVTFLLIGVFVWGVVDYQAPCTSSNLPYDECMERRAELREGQR